MPFASVNGTELYYERHGEGRSIVFCHGDGRDHRAWIPQVEGLSDDFEVITYDLNGFGRSGGLSRFVLSFDDSLKASYVYSMIHEMTAP